MRKHIFFALLTAAVLLTLASCMTMFGIKRYPIHRFTEEGALENGYESAAVVLVGTPVALDKYPGGRVDSGIIMRGNRACEVVELKPGKQTLSLLYYLRRDGKTYSSGTGNVNRLYKAGTVYRARYDRKNNAVNFSIQEIGPIEFPSTDGNAVARFVRLTPAEEAEDSAFAYEVSFKDGRRSSYPIYTFADVFPLVSPDKSSLALFSVNKDNTKIYIDGREETYDTVSKLGGSLSESEFVLFSPDSKHHAFVAGNDGKMFIVYDWKAGPQYDEVRRPQFSPDLKTFAYIAEKDDETFVVINGKEGKHYDGLYTIPFFSPDSRRYLYLTNNNILVVDGKEVDPDGTVLIILLKGAFSPDSNSYFYGVKNDDKYAMVLNGEKFREFSKVMIGRQVWSPDSSSILYWAQQDEKTYLMINDTIAAEVEKFDQDSLSFDEDGSHITYRTSASADAITIANPLK